VDQARAGNEAAGNDARQVATHPAGRLTICELVDRLVQKSYLLHQRIFYFFHADTTHYALDKGDIGMNGRRLGKKGLKIALPFDLLLQSRLGIAGQPADDPVDFFFRAMLTLRFFNI
jgi:hypothetical protein